MIIAASLRPTPDCSAVSGPSLARHPLIGGCFGRCQVGAFLLRQARRSIRGAFGFPQRGAAG